MSRGDPERSGKDERIELALLPQRPARTSRPSSKPPSPTAAGGRGRRERSRPGGAGPRRALGPGASPFHLAPRRRRGLDGTGVRVGGTDARHRVFLREETVAHRATPTRAASAVHGIVAGHRPAAWGLGWRSFDGPSRFMRAWRDGQARKRWRMAWKTARHGRGRSPVPQGWRDGFGTPPLDIIGPCPRPVVADGSDPWPVLTGLDEPAVRPGTVWTRIGSTFRPPAPGARCPRAFPAAPRPRTPAVGRWRRSP